MFVLTRLIGFCLNWLLQSKEAGAGVMKMLWLYIDRAVLNCFQSSVSALSAFPDLQLTELTVLDVILSQSWKKVSGPAVFANSSVSKDSPLHSVVILQLQLDAFLIPNSNLLKIRH